MCTFKEALLDKGEPPKYSRRLSSTKESLLNMLASIALPLRPGPTTRTRLTSKTCLKRPRGATAHVHKHAPWHSDVTCSRATPVDPISRSGPALCACTHIAQWALNKQPPGADWRAVMGTQLEQRHWNEACAKALERRKWKSIGTRHVRKQSLEVYRARACGCSPSRVCASSEGVGI